MATRDRSAGQKGGNHDSDDNYSYSDSFASDDEDMTPRRQRNVKSDTRGKRPPRGRGRGTTGRMSHEPRVENTARRVMSAKRLRYNKMRNGMEELEGVVKDLKEENKILKKMQYRQEKALQKFESKDSDLPIIMQRHNNEVRTLKEQHKKVKDKYDKTDRYLRDAEDELERTKTQLKKYKTLAEEKQLPEREDLNRKLSKAELDLEEKDCRIKDLEKHIGNLNKNHRHELGIEMARNRDVQKQIDQLREDKSKMEQQLKEKEKEIEMNNIYSNRASRPPHRLPASYSGTPHGTPPPRMKHRAPSIPDLSNRDKAKAYADHRREEERKKRDQQEVFAAPISRQDHLAFLKDLGRRAQKESQARDHELRRKWEDEEKENSRRKEAEHREREERKEREEHERRDEQERMKKDRFDQERKVKEERQQRENKFEFHYNDDRQNEERERRDHEDDDRRLKFDREKQKRDNEEREIRERERKEKEEKDWREREEQERRDRLERERRDREREEQERRAKEERERLANDKTALEERRKKDLILAKLRDLDEGKDKGKDSNKETDANPFFITANGRSDSDASTPTSKKSYTFTKPIENLHHGKPAREDVTVPYLEKQKRKKEQQDDQDLGGYQPTFNTRRGEKQDRNKPVSLFDDDDDSFASKPSKRTQKSNLMTELFGGQSESTKSNKLDDDIFSTPSKKKDTNRSAFPWEDDSKPVASTQSSQRRENSSTIFGGGNALVDDDETLHDNSKLLPRRHRQTSSTFATRPAVTAVDHYDDDIEEVIL